MKIVEASLNVTLRIIITVDIKSMCDLFRHLFLLLDLLHRLHPEGCVDHELNVVSILLDSHTILNNLVTEWDCDGCWDSPNVGLFDQSCTLTWELDNLALTVHDSISYTLRLLKFITHFAMSVDTATVLVVPIAEVLPIALVGKEGCIHPPLNRYTHAVCGQHCPDPVPTQERSCEAHVELDKLLAIDVNRADQEDILYLRREGDEGRLLPPFG